MTKLRALVPLLSFFLAAGSPAQILPVANLRIESLKEGEGRVLFNTRDKTAIGTNGIMVTYGDAVLTADNIIAHLETYEVIASGRVRIQLDDQVWAGEAVRYNFKNRQMQTEHFRTGRSPFFAEGEGLAGNFTNQTYTATATNAYLTTDDIAEPF